MMLVSIAMCTYNGARYLGEQLDSIAAQSFLPDELVICDDGSTDCTAAIAHTFALTAPFPVRFIQNQDNLGSTKNFEKAIGLCRGEFIALCDQDDVWNAEKLARLSALLVADPMLGGVFSDAELVDENTLATGEKLWDAVQFSTSSQRQIAGDLTKVLLKRDVVTGATLMFRAKLRNKVVPIDPAWVHDGWIAWMIASYSRLVPVCESLIKYRIHSSQQLGIDRTRTVSDRFARAKQWGREDYLRLAARYEAVRARWKCHPEEISENNWRDLQGKINLLYLQADLPKHRLLRVYRVLRATPAYYKYALGLKSMAKDLLLQRN